MSSPPVREEVLEVMLGQAVSTIEFLHGCLTDPIYRYDYPEQTERHLVDFKTALPERIFCIHSITQPGCEGCEQGSRHREVMAAWRETQSAETLP